MRLAPDKLQHLKAGGGVLAASFSFLALGQVLGLHAITTGLALAGLIAGAAVEYAQQNSNSRLAAMGQPELHDASLADLVASAAPCWLAATRMGYV